MFTGRTSNGTTPDSAWYTSFFGGFRLLLPLTILFCPSHLFVPPDSRLLVPLRLSGVFGQRIPRPSVGRPLGFRPGYIRRSLWSTEVLPKTQLILRKVYGNRTRSQVHPTLVDPLNLSGGRDVVRGSCRSSFFGIPQTIFTSKSSE